jgi:DegV family protein with EDD domain
MIKLVADSTCDLSDEILAKYDISIAPLTITIGEKTYKDRIDITPDEFYSMLSSLEKLPTTAMPSPPEFMSIFEEGLAKGVKDFICINMSSGTSGSYQSAVLAKNDFLEEHAEEGIRVHVVDSKCMSHGSGYLLMKTAMLREKGASFEELVDFNETFKTNVKHFLSVDDLDNLIKSGRLTNVSAMIGKLLKVKPIMSMRSGRGAIVAKIRGRKKVFKHYVAEFNRRVDEELSDFIIIGYTSDIALAENLRIMFENEVGYKGDIYIMQMGVSVGTHVGLGGLALYFIEEGHHHDGLIYNEMNQLLDKKNEMMKMVRRLKEKKLKSFDK